jgi:hypothetical protein
MSNGLRSCRCSRVVSHGGITGSSWRARCGSRSCGRSRKWLCATDTRASTGLRYGCALQPCNDWAQRIILVLRMYQSRIGVAHNLKLVRLQHSSQRVLKQAGVFRRPEVDVQCVQSVHVFALVIWVWRGEVPLGDVLVGARRRAAVLASEGVDSESEEAGVPVRVLYSDCIQFYVAVEVSSC